MWEYFAFLDAFAVKSLYFVTPSDSFCLFSIKAYLLFPIHMMHVMVAGITSCEDLPCINFGQCTDTSDDGYTCDCQNTGFKGEHCETSEW